MDWLQIFTSGSGVAALIAVCLTWFKFRPGQRELTDVSVAASSLNVLKGSIDVITDEFHEAHERLRAELAEDRATITALRSELLAAKMEAEHLRVSLQTTRADAERWKARYRELEARLA